jgi:hypothetical protein
MSASLRDHITDRYTKAIEQLGSDKLDVHLGGIHAWSAARGLQARPPNGRVIGYRRLRVAASGRADSSLVPPDLPAYTLRGSKPAH